MGCTCRRVLPVHPRRSSPICRANLIACGFRKPRRRSLPPLSYRWSWTFLRRPSSLLLTGRKPVTSVGLLSCPAQHGSVSAGVCRRMKTHAHVRVFVRASLSRKHNISPWIRAAMLRSCSSLLVSSSQPGSCGQSSGMLIGFCWVCGSPSLSKLPVERLGIAIVIGRVQGCHALSGRAGGKC